MPSTHATRWITPDLFDTGAVSLPQDFQFVAGSIIDISFPDGRIGRLTCTDHPPRPLGCRAYWTCSGSKYNGRAFDLMPGRRSDVFAEGQPIMYSATMILVPKD